MNIFRKFPLQRWDVWQYLVLLLIIFLPRVLGVNQFLTIDEDIWTARTINFYRGLCQGNFAQTYQAEHPGVTLMWAGSAGLYFEGLTCDVAGTGAIRGQQEAFLQENGHSPVDFLAKSRTIMTLANTIVLLVSYGFARRLLGNQVAFIGFTFIALTPFHIAHTRLLHLDGMLSGLLLLSFLAYLTYRQTANKGALIISGAAAGLSWLTKAPGLFLIPIVGLITLLDLAQGFNKRQKQGWCQFSSPYLSPLLVWGITAVSVFIIFWPSMWVAPTNTLARMFSVAFSHAEAGHESPAFFLGQVFTDGKLGPTFYPVTYLWRSTPIGLAGLVFFFIGFAKHRKNLPDKIRNALSGFILFAVIFALLLTFGLQKFDRYLLPIYAPLLLCSGWGWVYAVSWLTSRFQILSLRVIFPLLLATILLLEGFYVWQTFPYYLDYFNPVLGGPEKAADVLTIGWGEGLDQAARYLNTKPNTATLLVTAWYRPSFSYFFDGRTNGMPNGADITEEQLKNMLDTDYIVIYIHQWQRQIPFPLLQFLKDQQPEHIIFINDIPYVSIYSMSEIETTTPGQQEEG